MDVCKEEKIISNIVKSVFFYLFMTYLTILSVTQTIRVTSNGVSFMYYTSPCVLRFRGFYTFTRHVDSVAYNNRLN